MKDFTKDINAHLNYFCRNLDLSQDDIVSFRLKISFSISSFGMTLKEKNFLNCCCKIAKILGWFFIFFYFFQWIKFTDRSLYWGILKFETIFGEKIIKDWRHFSIIIYNLIILNKGVLYLCCPFIWGLIRTVLLYSRTIYCLWHFSDSGY